MCFLVVERSDAALCASHQCVVAFNLIKEKNRLEKYVCADSSKIIKEKIIRKHTFCGWVDVFD